jgi:cardiolipin synthase
MKIGDNMTKVFFTREISEDSLVKMFCQLYNVASKNKLEVEKFLEKSHQIYQNHGYVLPYMDGPAPVFKEHISENAYLNVINKAVDYLYITSPYLVVDNVIIDALINASLRGVDVKIILPEIPDKKIVSVLTRSNYEKLIAGGVKVYEYKGGFIHSKMVISDNAMIIGTINFDYRSFIHHFENAVYTTCESCLNSATLDFNYMVENEGVLITKQKAKQSTVSKLIKGVLTVFSPLF